MNLVFIIRVVIFKRYSIKYTNIKTELSLVQFRRYTVRVAAGKFFKIWRGFNLVVGEKNWLVFLIFEMTSQGDHEKTWFIED